jgi:hypothetical protein
VSRHIAIVGARCRTDRETVDRLVASLPADTMIVSGGAIGPDTWADEAARERGLATKIFWPHLHGVDALSQGQITRRYHAGAVLVPRRGLRHSHQRSSYLCPIYNDNFDVPSFLSWPSVYADCVPTCNWCCRPLLADARLIWSSPTRNQGRHRHRDAGRDVRWRPVGLPVGRREPKPTPSGIAFASEGEISADGWLFATANLGKADRVAHHDGAEGLQPQSLGAAQHHGPADWPQKLYQIYTRPLPGLRPGCHGGS